MLSIQEEQKVVADAVAKFPEEFGLRAFPGKRFKILRQQSYVSEGVVMLYTGIRTGDRWECFCKGTVEELQMEVTK